MKYEDKVKEICGDDWRKVNDDERDGGYGVACLIAYIRGCRPNLQDIARHLGATADEINTSYIRLSRNGAFHRDGWNARQDTDLLGETTEEGAQHIWAFVAAVAGGFLGVPC